MFVLLFKTRENGEHPGMGQDRRHVMLVYFVRHGQTTWNKRKKLQGQHDTKLTPRGLEQARLAGEGMSDIPFDYIISSPLSRARMTAEIIRGDRPLEIEFDDRLKEIDFGRDNGRCFGKMLKDSRYVRYYRFFHEPDKYKPIKGAESYREVIARADEFFREKIIPLENEKNVVLVVGHTTWMHAFIVHITGRPMSRLWDSSFGKNCEAVIFEVKNGEMSMVFENRMFYDEDDLTIP